MSRFALIGLAVVAGCFYTDEVNQRPSLDIHRLNEGPYFRGDLNKTIELEAVSNDPEGHSVSYRWRAYACTDQSHCDLAQPYFEKTDTSIRIPVPTARFESSEPVKGVYIKLEGKDAYGAIARPVQELWVDVDNAPPNIVALAGFSDYDFVVGAPVKVFAEVVDTDDSMRTPDVTWTVFPNMPANYTFVDTTAVPSHGGMAFGKLFTPSVTGKFMFTFTASDGQVMAERTAEVTITPDKPPCLSTLSPIVAVAPAALPISEPTLFQVHVVSDDLDPYPSTNDLLGITGITKFTWSLLAPGGPRQPLTGVTGNSVSIDPAAYQPGDILELRVEIADRKNTPITCVDANATCSVISTSCIQRQTWRVEVR